MNQLKTAIIYCRVSTDKQGQNGESLDIQEMECRAYCEKMHITVVEVFREQFTGTSIQRPALNEAIVFLQKQRVKINYCIIHKIDRSTRGGLGDYFEIKRKLEENGTQLKDTYGIIQDEVNVVNIENFDTGIYDWSKINPSEIAVSMSVLSAKQERTSILQRTIPQEIRNTQNGYISRQSNFGYQNKKICTEDGKLKTIYIPDPIESKWVKTMFELKATGELADHDIVKLVNQMGFITRKTKVWNSSKTTIIGFKGGNKLDTKSLQKFIEKPIYAGVICEKWTGNKPIRGKFEALISIEIYNQANKGKRKIIEMEGGKLEIVYGVENLKEQLIQRRIRHNPEYPFSKVIRCPQCDGYLTPNKSKSANGKLFYYYQCKGKGGVKHKNYTENRDQVNQILVNYLSSIEIDEEYLPKILGEIDKIWNERSKEIQNKANDIILEIQKLESSKNSIHGQIEKLLNFPELLSLKNGELIEINNKLNELRKIKIIDDTNTEKTKFIEFTKNIIKHIAGKLQEEKDEDNIRIIFDILFEQLPTYQNIQSQTANLFPIFRLASKKRAIDDSLVCMNNNLCTGWQPRRESNSDRRIWSPEF